MDATKNTVPEGQSSTVQEVRTVLSQGVYINFEIEGIDRVKALIKHHRELLFNLEHNLQEIDRVLVRLNAKVSEKPIDKGCADYEV